MTCLVNFKEIHLHEHELKVSDYNIKKYFDPNKYVFLILFTIFHFDPEKFKSKNCKYIFFYQKFAHLGENTTIYCCRIIVVHVHAAVFFSKVHPACNNIANGIKPGSTSKKTDKHAADCSKAVCWGIK